MNKHVMRGCLKWARLTSELFGVSPTVAYEWASILVELKAGSEVPPSRVEDAMRRLIQTGVQQGA